jgi:hypothetical protein
VILAVDSSALALLVNPAADPPEDPKTGQPVLHIRQRVEHLIAGIGASDTLVVPTPVLAEAMVRAEEGGPCSWELCGVSPERNRPVRPARCGRDSADDTQSIAGWRQA